MFLPYRTIGYVVDKTPPAIIKRGNHHFITASIGRSWHVFKSNTLRTRLISPERESQIGVIASVTNFTCSTIGRQLLVWQRFN